jgi:NAD(P)-dependent dehydrogenase (short-subunit alcohol dehydrogenase family)
MITTPHCRHHIQGQYLQAAGDARPPSVNRQKPEPEAATANSDMGVPNGSWTKKQTRPGDRVDGRDRICHGTRPCARGRCSDDKQRFIEPEEVAALITYVCSAQASATTGAALRVDGGVVRAIV